MEYKPLKIGDLEARVPIIQGGMGIGISLGNLAGAVAKSGGVGIISAAQIGFKEELFQKNPLEANLIAMGTELEKARTTADGGIVGFNIMVAMDNYEKYVRRAVEIGTDLIISGAGLPTELPSYVEGSNTKIAPIVSTAKGARTILKYWARKHGRTADMLVVEGPEAGGHLGFKVDEIDAYSQGGFKEEVVAIIELVKEYEAKFDCQIPVVVAGGIHTSAKVEEVLNLGASGVQIASRFVATKECDASDAFKEAYVNSSKETIRIVKSPVGMPGRAISNTFIDKVMSGVKQTPKKCYRCIAKCVPSEIPYCITEALIKAVSGDVDNGLVFCGANTGEIGEISTVEKVMSELTSSI